MPCNTCCAKICVTVLEELQQDIAAAQEHVMYYSWAECLCRCRESTSGIQCSGVLAEGNTECAGAV
jgi:hypothetical protein